MDMTLHEIMRQKAFYIRRDIIMTIVKNGEGHVGPALSCADILAVLFFGVLHKGEQEQDTDRFLLSAGHKCLALYSALAEAGVVSRETLDTYNKLGSRIPGHPDMNKLPGIDFSTGSLGHGLGIACGFALANKRSNGSGRCFVLMGDGEQAEGSVWEAAAFAAGHELDNIIAFVDQNGLQVRGRTCDVLDLPDLASRYQAFGWQAYEICGHDLEAIYEGAQSAPKTAGKPTVFICRTVKGKGLPFAEGNAAYHHWNPNDAEKAAAIDALKQAAEQERWKL